MYQILHPEELRIDIIKNNMNLLTGNLPSYDKQIEKILIRKDIVSINYSVAAFLESYLDIIFAINASWRKKMITYAKSDATILPEAFNYNFRRIISEYV